MTERETPHVDWRRVVIGVALAVAVGAAVVVGVGKAAGFERVEETFRRGNLGWLAVCGAAQILVFAGYAAVYRNAVAFEGGPRIGNGLSLRVVLPSFGLTQVIAAAGAAGIAVHYWAMRRLGFERREAAVRVIGFNTLVYLVFALVGLAAAVLALVLGDAPLGMSLGWIGAIPVILLAADLFTAPRRVRTWTEGGGNVLRRALAIGVGAAWWVRRSLHTREGHGMLLGAAAYWLGGMVSLWAALHAFGSDASLADTLLAFTTGYAAQIVPLPFIATGGVDAATAFSLEAVGVPLEIALLGVIANRVFTFWLPLWPALVLALLLPRTGRRLEEATAGG